MEIAKEKGCQRLASFIRRHTHDPLLHELPDDEAGYKRRLRVGRADGSAVRLEHREILQRFPLPLDFLGAKQVHGRHLVKPRQIGRVQSEIHSMNGVAGVVGNVTATSQKGNQPNEEKKYKKDKKNIENPEKND